MSVFSIGLMSNSQSLVVYLKMSKTIENSYSTQVRQQYLRCNYTKFKLEIPIVSRYMLNFPKVPIFLLFLLGIEREQNGTFTEISEALWKFHQN